MDKDQARTLGLPPYDGKAPSGVEIRMKALELAVAIHPQYPQFNPTSQAVEFEDYIRNGHKEKP